MRLPVTFKVDNLNDIVQQWIRDERNVNLTKESNIVQTNNYTQYIF
jgi:hypothetical protein